MGANSAEDIAHGIRELVDKVLMKQPHAKVLLLGVIPRDGTLEKKVQAINTIIAKYNDDKRVFYLDMSPKFQTSPGVEVKELYTPDKVHLVQKGYEVWYETMEPLFAKLLAE